ncbi:MAG: hypothetical protein CM1200mP21_04470 [Candidatus Poseidoniales archaeon]|nr:MAG: hypothetical protein CM1200mP21_04470 [Candidatus Poseidoniales archaeon]
MSQVESDEEAPPGFIALRFAGIGMMARMIEPESLSEPEDWSTMVGDLGNHGEKSQIQIQYHHCRKYPLRGG